MKVLERARDKSPIDLLADRLSLSIPNIMKSRAAAQKEKNRIREVVGGINFQDTTSLVVFGSLARDEWTSGSDVDWTLLLDGPADPQHFRIVAEVADRLEKAELKEPGNTGRFGNLASSHELVHNIGGETDTNANMTRRTLLLLESAPILQEAPRERVIRAILNRYIVCGPGVPEPRNALFRCPRFLLNDVVRLWRTFAVDYAAKKWQQSNDKWALRNAKLRIPRKLTFVKGLLTCFDCELFSGEPPWEEIEQLTNDQQELVMTQRLLEGCLLLKLPSNYLLEHAIG
jgi:predicted nucleotidyltransferase